MTGKRRAGKDPIQPPVSSHAPPVVMAPQQSRRQARLERKKQQRKRIGLAGGAAIAVAVIVVVGAVAFGVRKATEGGGESTRTQSTVLFQLRAPDGTAAGSVLLAHDTNGNEGLEVLVPSRIITDVCGYNSLNFGDVLALPAGDSASRQALSTMLENVTIDGSWVLDEAQFAKLIDRVGGVTANVDTDVVQHTGGGGGRILVPAGPDRHLTGTQALQYATYRASRHEDASAQLARLHQVVDGMILRLPPPTALAADLRVLGSGGTSTMGATRLTALLSGLQAADKTAGHVLPIDLPTALIDAGGAPSYRIDTINADKLAATNLKSSLPADAGHRRPTVELLNGVGTPGLISLACPRLQAHHLAYAGSGNAASFNNPHSTIEVSNNNVELGYTVASALRLPRSDVRRTSQNQSVADVIVILGRDFK
jgi:hypothetical protein